MKLPTRGTLPFQCTPLSIADVFWRNVFQSGEQIAFVDSSDVSGLPAEPPFYFTWWDLGCWCASLAEQLTSLGFAKGDRLSSWIPNSLDWILVDIACQTLGVCHAAVDFREPEAVARRLSREVDATFLLTSDRTPLGITLRAIRPADADGTKIDVSLSATTADHQAGQAELSQRVNSIRRQPTDDAPAQILFTSGSTGSSKPVHLSAMNLFSNAMAKLDAAPQRESDLRLNILPFTHAYARTCELSTWILSGCSLAISGNWGSFVRKAARLRPTLVNCVPYLAQRIAQALEADPLSLGGKLRLLQVGGAALPVTLFDRLSSLGLPPICGYGLTETSPVVCSNRDLLQLPGTVGFPVQNTDIRVAASGELYVRGPGVMLGYGNNGKSPIDGDGWLATGDLASIRADGHVVLHGRMNQQIVLSTGYQVDPSLVESRIQLSGLVSHCLVTGDGQPSLTAHIAFHPTTGSGGSFEAAAEDLRDHLAYLLDDLPRHASPQFFKPFPFLIGDNPHLLTAKGTLRRKCVISAIADSRVC